MRACTVLVNGRRINACLALAAVHDGDEITTIEGLAKGEELHALQAVFGASVTRREFLAQAGAAELTARVAKLLGE